MPSFRLTRKRDKAPKESPEPPQAPAPPPPSPDPSAQAEAPAPQPPAEAEAPAAQAPAPATGETACPLLHLARGRAASTTDWFVTPEAENPRPGRG